MRGNAESLSRLRGSIARLTTIMVAACSGTEESATPDSSMSDAVVRSDVSASLDVVEIDVADVVSTVDDAPFLPPNGDVEAPDSVEAPNIDSSDSGVDAAPPSGDTGCEQTLPECPPGDVRTATDLDGDGCPDTCCFSECPTDFVASDFDGDGCGDSCGDKPCSAAADCSLYACAFAAGNCSAPQGVCSNFACQDAGPVCGCDGTTYETGCLANASGVPVASDGACPPPT